MLQENMKNKNIRVHPTQKPVELFQWLIKEYSVETDLILDPFMGSWTTARACKDLGRNFIGFELEKKYCEIGEERLKQEVMDF
jgi:site-specific DNA-methyltransferase (adenine-specific)